MRVAAWLPTALIPGMWKSPFFLRPSGSNGSTFEPDGLPFFGPLLKVPKCKGEPFVSRSLGQMRKRTGSLLGRIVIHQVGQFKVEVSETCRGTDGLA